MLPYILMRIRSVGLVKSLAYILLTHIPYTVCHSELRVLKASLESLLCAEPGPGSECLALRGLLANGIS